MALIGTTGFFTRLEVKAKGRVKEDSGLSEERLRKIGLKGVDRMNPAAISPHMPPVGSKRPQIYVLGDAPSVADDKAGAPFKGETGEKLRACLPAEFRYRFSNIVRTLPRKRGKDRNPTTHEIACYHESVSTDIAITLPRAILAVGAYPAAWAIGDAARKAGIAAIRGRRFPVRIGDHLCWVYPVIHPADIVQQENSEEYKQIKPDEHWKYLQRDIDNMAAELSGESLPAARVENPAKSLDGIIIERRSINVIKNFLAEMREEGCVFLDTETNRLRPYAAGAKLLTLAIGTRDRVISFPVDHPQAEWTKEQRKELHRVVGDFLVSKVPKGAHNTPFDLEWLLREWGDGILFESFWHDSMGQAYCIDERQGALSLDYLCVQHFGLELKAQSAGRKMISWLGVDIEQESDIDRAALEQTNVLDVCKYNGRDTKYEHGLYTVQKSILKEKGLWGDYKQWVKRVTCLAKAQEIGVPVSEEKNKELKAKIAPDITRARKAVFESKAVKKFEAQTGKAYIDSNPNNKILFRDILKREEGKTRTGYSAGEKALEKMVDVPVAAALLELRGLLKMQSTYLDRLSKAHPETFVYPDGRVHSSFRHCRTDTKRIQSTDPSLLNQPREDAWIKAQYVAAPGCVCLFSDYGAQEARCIAIMSQDPNLVKFLREGFDFHMVWAEKIVRKWDKTCKARHGNPADPKVMKAFRQDVKAQWSFAGFYNAKVASRAMYLDMPVRIAQALDEEFWSEEVGFAGVKKWQKRVIKIYEEKGYVESLMGHRRHGPMNTSMVVNAGVQASGTDMTADAWARINRIAYETDRPWLYMPLAVHDDLTSFYIPKKKVDEAVEVIATEMCHLPFAWGRDVPIVAEISQGPNWAEKTKIGEFSSYHLKKDLEKCRVSALKALPKLSDGNFGNRHTSDKWKSTREK